MLNKKILLKLSKYFKVLFFIYIFLIFYLSSITDINTGLPEYPNMDKVLHFIEFGILAGIGVFAFRKHRKFKLKLLVFAIFFAFSDEFHQYFVRGRDADILDFLVDISPFMILYFLNFRININSVRIKGLYRNKIFELLRSIIPDINFKKNGRAELTVWIKDKYIYFFINNKYTRKVKLKNNEVLNIKRNVFREFQNLLDDIISEWGIIYQTRPIKKIKYMDFKNIDGLEYRLKKKYLMSRKKINLLADVYRVKKRAVKKAGKNAESLYVGIPFCPSKCAYCSFTSYPMNKFSKYYDQYVEMLIDEIKLLKNDFKNNKIKIIYFGGGTPFILKNDDLIKIFDEIFSFVNADKLIEFSFEGGRPEILTDKKLEILKRYGVNRISVNPQTLNDKTLTRVKRKHTIKDFYDAYKKVKNYKFDIINSDLILGLPGEKFKHHKKTINELIKLELINNITVHVLSPKTASKLYKEGYDFDKDIKKSYSYFRRKLKKNNFYPYYLYKQRHIIGNLENIGFSKNTKWSFYNIFMIAETNNIYGVGAGATTKIIKDNEIINRRNPKDIAAYMKKIEGCHENYC